MKNERFVLHLLHTRSHVTNLNWSLNGAELSALLGIKRFLLINDFAAIGYGLLALRDDDKILLNKDAVPVQGAPIACLGAGTGLGEVYLTNGGGAAAKYEVWPCEGGHTDYAPRNQVEFDLMNFMRERERVERVRCALFCGFRSFFISSSYQAFLLPSQQWQSSLSNMNR